MPTLEKIRMDACLALLRDLDQPCGGGGSLDADDLAPPEPVPLPTASNSPAHLDTGVIVDALLSLPYGDQVAERRALVSDVFGGYPAVGRRLDWLEWNGARRPFANALVQLLDGVEAAPGLPALLLLAEHLEQEVTAEHLGPLAQLRRRLSAQL